MLSDITTANAKADGKEFRFWFAGEIDKWCRENNISVDSNKFGLLNTRNKEVKWGIYKKEEVRAAWVSCSDKTAMSILIRGCLIFYFREPEDNDKIREVRLKEEGDYVIWRENVEHTWEISDDSEILSI